MPKAPIKRVAKKAINKTSIKPAPVITPELIPESGYQLFTVYYDTLWSKDQTFLIEAFTPEEARLKYTTVLSKNQYVKVVLNLPNKPDAILLAENFKITRVVPYK